MTAKTSPVSAKWIEYSPGKYHLSICTGPHGNTRNAFEAAVTAALKTTPAPAREKFSATLGDHSCQVTSEILLRARHITDRLWPLSPAHALMPC